MNDRAVLERNRALAYGHLSGQLKALTPVCLKCGERVLVKLVQLEMDEGRGMTGSAVDVRVAACLNDKCGHVAAKNWGTTHQWRYGRTRVEMVEVQPYDRKELPLVFSQRQRQAMQEFLDNTAP